MKRRSFPTVNLQGVDIRSLASTDNSRRRSFPALELLEVDVEGGRRSFPGLNRGTMTMNADHFPPLACKIWICLIHG
jgi:hypothetical protein